MSASHFVKGQWIEGSGPSLTAIDPGTRAVSWQGRSATPNEVAQAASAARGAWGDWSARAAESRSALLGQYALELKNRIDELAEAISRESGKPLWESRTEVEAMVRKIAISEEAWQAQKQNDRRDLGNVQGFTRFRPHGVLAVIGPFNLPGHIPNGHIVPALLAGNTVVLKPSEKTPTIAALMMECFVAAGFPPGVINLVQGGRQTAESLVGDDRIDGVLFTGSVGAGVSVSRALADKPWKIVALEMGGNNPLVVHEVAGAQAAAYVTIQSAFITSGQRCTCAHRLIVPAGAVNDRYLEGLARMTEGLSVGHYSQRPEPFIGPVISDQSAHTLMDTQADFLKRGGRSLVPMRRISDNLLSPGIIDVTNVADRADQEVFGPLLQVIRVDGFQQAIDQANLTRYGLAAGLLSDDRALWEKFAAQIRAGVISFNRQTTNASSYLPFGGVGLSGNHRPSGFSAAQYCSWPVASLEANAVEIPAKVPPGVIV